MFRCVVQLCTCPAARISNDYSVRSNVTSPRSFPGFHNGHSSRRKTRDKEGHGSCLTLSSFRCPLRGQADALNKLLSRGRRYSTNAIPDTEREKCDAHLLPLVLY
jgi:hypothetical protein